MNAATVIGPRSRISSAIFALRSAIPSPEPPALFLANGHELLVPVAPDEQPGDSAGRDFGQLAARLNGRRDGLSIDRENHVPGPQVPRGVAVGGHVVNNGALLARWHRKGGGHLWGQILERQAESGCALFLRRRSTAAVIPASTAQ